MQDKPHLLQQGGSTLCVVVQILLFFFFEWILIVRSTWHAVDFEGKAGQDLPMLFLQPLEKVVLPVEGGSGGGGC